MGAGPREARFCSGLEAEDSCLAILVILTQKAEDYVRPTQYLERQPAHISQDRGLSRPDCGVLSFLYSCGMHTGCFCLIVFCEIITSHGRTPRPHCEGQASPAVRGSLLLLFIRVLASPTHNMVRFISDGHSMTHKQGLISSNEPQDPPCPCLAPSARSGLPSPPPPSPLTCAGLICLRLVWCW